MELYVYSLFRVLLLSKKKILLKRSVLYDERTEPEEYGLKKVLLQGKTQS